MRFAGWVSMDYCSRKRVVGDNLCNRTCFLRILMQLLEEPGGGA